MISPDRAEMNVDGSRDTVGLGFAASPFYRSKIRSEPLIPVPSSPFSMSWVAISPAFWKIEVFESTRGG